MLYINSGLGIFTFSLEMLGSKIYSAPFPTFPFTLKGKGKGPGQRGRGKGAGAGEGKGARKRLKGVLRQRGDRKRNRERP